MTDAAHIDSIAVKLTGLSALPLALLIAAGIALALWYYRDPVPPVSSGLRWLLTFLRASAITLLFLALAEPILKIVLTTTHAWRVAVLLDTSSSMDQAADPARKSDALAALEAARKSLGGRGLYRAFGDRLHPLVNGTPAFDSPATDISSALNGMAKDRDIAACVLISDGRWNRGEDPSNLELPEGLPVYTVLSGSVPVTPDIVLRRVSASPVGHDGKSLPVEITISASGKAPGSIPVEILEKGRILAAGKVALQGSAAAGITLQLPLKGPGGHTYTVRVSPAFSERTENNARSFGVRVLKSSFAVLMLAPTPSPDFAFIRRAAESDSEFTVRAIAGPLTGGSGAFPDDLTRFDAVIIVDGGGIVLTPERARMLVPWLAGGKGLWVVGSTPLSPGSPLEAVLPLAYDRGKGLVAIPMGLSLTEAGRSHFLTTGSIGPDDWAVLPPISSLTPTKSVSSGQVLVTAAIGVKQSPPSPAIAAGAHVRGKVLEMPFSGVWRWRLMMEGAGKGGALFDTFVRGAIRWLASETEMSPLTVVTDAESYMGGQEVRFEGRVFDTVFMPVPGAEVSLTLDNDTARKVILEEKQPGVYEGAAQTASPGGHSWSANAFVGGKQYATASGKFTVDTFSLEMLDSSPDPETLGAIAHRSGGLAVTSAGVDSVLSKLKPRMVTEREEAEHHPTLSPFLPALVILLLAVEWFIRKRRGMI